MPFSALIIALGKALGAAIAKKSMDKAADAVVSPLTAKARDALEKKLNVGQYAVIQRALRGARQDVLRQCDTPEQEQLASQVLDTLINSPESNILDDFSKQVTQTYLLPSPEPVSTEPLVRTYRKLSGPVAIVQDEVADEATITSIFSSYFLAYRERLLREPSLSHLREYFQLTETRRQTDLQKAMLERLDAIAANTARPVENLSRLDHEYREYLIKELKDHVIRGFAPQVGSRVLSLPLAKIFLPLQAVEGRPALAEYAEADLRRQALNEALGELDWRRWREEMEKRYAQLSARQAAQRPLTLAELLKNSRSMLLGDPGTGKTTITRYIAYALAAEDYIHTGDSVRSLTPVLIRIANYGQAFERDKTLHLIEYIEEELTQQPETGQYLRQRIEDGQCLIILDGLDEITNPNLRIQVTDRIQALVAGFSNNHFMVTSRIVGYDMSPMTRDFKHATLKEMSGDDQARFIGLWYDAIKSEIGESTHADGADDLIKALRDKPQIARMAANPLLLTIMVLMHWRGTKLPGQRVKVYENATDTLVEYWTAQRAVETLDAQEVKAVLAPIAHYILSSNVGGVIAHQDLLPRFYQGITEQRGCDQHEARSIGKEMLKDLNEQSGIFLERGRDANDQPVYGFLHQTFGEYLAALNLAHHVLGGTFNLDASCKDIADK